MFYLLHVAILKVIEEYCPNQNTSGTTVCTYHPLSFQQNEMSSEKATSKSLEKVLYCAITSQEDALQALYENIKLRLRLFPYCAFGGMERWSADRENILFHLVLL